MAISQYIVRIGNLGAGSSANLALSNHFIDDAPGDGEVTANLCAFFMGWGQMAVNSYIDGISKGPIPPGATLPVSFGATEYAALRVLDPLLPAMAAYGTLTGGGALATLGVGIVVGRHTATPGRSARGRFTIPLLDRNGVSNGGDLVNTVAPDVAAAADLYLVTNMTSYGRSSTYMTDIPILNHTVADRLGRVRSRSR